MDTHSELRQDIVSGDWVLIVNRKDKKPHEFRQTEKIKRHPKRKCPFENPEEAGGGGVILAYPNKKNWKLMVVPNKFPVATQSGEWVVAREKHGPFRVIPGFGHHELLITRDHNANFPKLHKQDAFLVFKAFRERYKCLSVDKNIAYVTIYHNWGPRAGASIYHPHYQILAIPVIPPDAEHSLRGSEAYYKKNKKCVHCVQISWEKKQNERVIYENKDSIVFAPYVSKEQFELRVFPKKHSPYFEEASDATLKSVTTALQISIQKLEKALGNVNYNFFIHTAPLKDKEKHNHYHWHIEIMPRLNIAAGFELSTNVEINNTDPDCAANILNSAK